MSDASHQPQRTCIACRAVLPKRLLVRFARSRSGELSLDLKAKKAGRGTYVCRSRDCWESLLQKGRLERAAHAELTPQQRAEVAALAVTFAPRGE